MPNDSRFPEDPNTGPMSPEENRRALLDKLILAHAIEKANELDVDEPELVMPPPLLQAVKSKE